MTEESTQSDSTRQFLGERGIPQALQTLTRWQLGLVLAILIALAATMVLGFAKETIFIVNACFAMFFLVSVAYRVTLIDTSLRQHQEIHVSPTVAEREDWPAYVIQVPLYHEAHAIPRIIEGLGALDYPKDRLTIQLLVEEDDAETKAAVGRVEINPPFKVVNVPVSHPRTKPKACNVGLAAADGDYLVIYDAEDRPEPDQLKKAVIAFDESPENVACIQGKLNFYNPDKNLLTRCFTAEYSMWFDLCLPGLDVYSAPIPLGGTSNHFKLSILKELKGWDEYNVTEDCDLGLRLFVRGYRTRMLDSTTWEEACSHWPIWLRQRSRWVKGYVQTYLVHTRHPLKLFRDLGLRGSFHFHLLIGGSVVSQLLSPFYWALVGIWLIAVFGGASEFVSLQTFQHVLSTYFPLPVFAMAALCLFVGNFLMVYSSAAACAQKRLSRLIKFAPFMPVYWLIMGLAAWKGTLQLIWRPHYWEKTQHYEEADSAT